MALASLYSSAGGAGMQTVGSYYSSLGEKQALGLQADLDAINARLAEGAARDTLARGEKEYGASRLRTAALRGSQRAAIADSGFDLGFGSAAQILTGTDFIGDTDANTIKANAVREAWGHRLDASNLRGSSRVNRAAAKSINPTLNAAATLLTAGGQVAGEYYKLKSSGAIGGKTGGKTVTGGGRKTGGSKNGGY